MPLMRGPERILKTSYFGTYAMPNTWCYLWQTTAFEDLPTFQFERALETAYVSIDQAKC